MGHSDEIRLSDLKTIPNILSISRLVLIPAMLIPAYLIDDEPYARLVFLIMFIVIGITDKPVSYTHLTLPTIYSV